MPPLVSICLPVLDGQELIGRAVRSALAQDYPDVEVVVVDDASTDATVRVLQHEFGDRIRLFRRARRSGQARTTNAAMALARGEYIKFLHHDDVLGPDCVTSMVEMMERHSSAGMAFSRRHVEHAAAESSEEWVRRYGEVHRGFGELAEANPGGDLFTRLLADDLHNNWFGEPVCVMVRRAIVEKVGGFGLHLRGSIDLGLWLRIAAHSDVVFIDRELVTYRHSTGSHMKQARARGETWLDRLWMLELLCTYPNVVQCHPRLMELRRRERAMARRTAAAAMIGRSAADLSTWREYEWFRLRRLIARAPMAGSLGDSAAGTAPVASAPAAAIT